MRVLLIAFLLLLQCATTFAQPFKGGLLAGLSASQVEGDGYSGYKRAGLVAGMWIGLPLANDFAARLEFKLAQKGSYERLNDEVGEPIGFYSLRLSYMEMPLLLEYRFREKITPYAGISTGYLWKATERNADGSFPSSEIDLFRKIELAGVIGVAYVITPKLSLCASLSYSLLAVRPHRGNISYQFDTGLFNNSLQFYLRYHF